MSKAEETAWKAAMACQRAADELLGGSCEACVDSSEAFKAYIDAYSALRKAQNAAVALGIALGEEERKSND